MSGRSSPSVYRPLLSIDVAHGYYADGRCRGLRFTPTPATREWLQANDAVDRDTGSGLVVHVAQARSAAAPQAPARLAWTVQASDPMFTSISEKFDLQDGRKTLVFGSDAVDPQADAVWRLHAGAVASQDDVWHLQSPALRSLLGDADRKRASAFVVSLVVPAPAAIGALGLRYRIAFAARAPVWKYCLIGPWSDQPKALEVVGEARDPVFSAPQEEALDNGQKLLAFRSVRGIALAERGQRHFKLRDNSTLGGPRVLVDRLPVAGTGHFTREDFTQPPTLVCAIYVHANPLRRPPWQQ